MALLDQPLVNPLSEGRLQLRHGPIDLIIEALGVPAEVEQAYKQATAAFSTVLGDLVAELSDLRKQQGAGSPPFQGNIANTMAAVATSFGGNHFVTPMITVAGAVADHVLQAMTSGRDLSKAYVNNGGDIAIYLSQQQCFNVGVCANPVSGAIVSSANITECSGIRGVATSGWRGRSHSLGIADSVTVLARTAAIADAAATLIANAIDLPNHPMIKRKAAIELDPDSDLGQRLVTIDVGELTHGDTLCALESGQRVARSMIDAKQITGVYGSLNAQVFSLNSAESDQCFGRPTIDHSVMQLACS